MKAFLIIIILFSSLFINSCEEESIQPPIEESIKIIQPVNNSTVHDSATIIVQINNSKKIVRTEINIDHDTTIVFTKPPFTYLWNTSLYNDGSQHLIEAAAYSKNSEVINAKPVIIYVSRFIPRDLSALLISDTTIQLNWIDNCNFETGFEIEEAVGDSSFINVAHVDSNVTGYIIKGKFDDTTKYLFRVRAKSGTLLSGYSNIASTEIAMNPPSNIRIIFTSDTTAIIHWIDNNNFEDGYSVFGEGGNHTSLLAKVPPNSTSANIKGLFLIGHLYGFKVAATYNEIISYSETIWKPFTLNPPISLMIKSLSDNSIQLS